MRAVLVVNPQATSTTPGGRDVLAHALASEVKLEVVETTHRGHAAHIAEMAARDGVELVVAHGGDGTVNEVVNGILPPDPAKVSTATPMLGVVPGGSANVFARAIGYPRDPVEATHILLDALSRERVRRIGLGMAGGQWFTFSAGMGWDADVVAGVDRSRGKQASPALYTRIAATSYLFPPSGRPKLVVGLPGEDPVEVRTAFVSNTDPWTYLGPRPMRLNPGCSFEGGIALFAPRSLDPFTVLGLLRQALSSSGYRGGRHVVHHDDLKTLHVRCDKPVNLQVDGDLAGERTSVEFRSVPDALTVVV
ncbi:MAG: diacylglycerol kinase family lipid kinase [Actinophytocola sp.]|nr:diacylglycerol kinase family lipid kinase [Actinophytocola sp.]